VWDGKLKLNSQLFLFSILLIGAILRLQFVSEHLVDGFSWREASTAMMADNFLNRSWNIFFPEVSWTGADPGYQGRELAIVPYLAAVLNFFLGWQDWTGRAVATAFGVLTIFSLHRLLSNVWGTLHAHAGAFVYAILPGAVMIDSSYLPDPAMLALTVTGLWMFVSFLRNRSYRWLAGALVFLALGILAKLPGIAVLAAVFYAAFEWIRIGIDQSKRRFLTLLTSMAALGLVIFAYYSWALYLGRVYPPYHVAGSGYLWTDGFEKLIQEHFYLGKTWNVARIWFATLPVMFIAGIGLMFLPPKTLNTATPRLGYLFHAWLIGAVLVYLVAAREISANVWNYHIFSVPLAAFGGRGLLLIARATENRPSWPWFYARMGALGAVVVGLGTLPGTAIMKRPGAMAAYELGSELERLTEPGDLVIAMAPNVGDPIAIYYSRRRGWVFPPAGGQNDWSIFYENDVAIASLEKLKAAGAKWFAVPKDTHDSLGRDFFDHHKPLVDYLERTSKRVADEETYVIYQL
jgi:4-amino-4-deoxy-L-arabinose transferase-like glycosyltransferase